MKEEREAKRAQLEESHHQLITTAADALNIGKNEAEDSLLEGSQVLRLSLCQCMCIRLHFFQCC